MFLCGKGRIAGLLREAANIYGTLQFCILLLVCKLCIICAGTALVSSHSFSTFASPPPSHVNQTLAPPPPHIPPFLLHTHSWGSPILIIGNMTSNSCSAIPAVSHCASSLYPIPYVLFILIQTQYSATVIFVQPVTDRTNIFQFSLKRCPHIHGTCLGTSQGLSTGTYLIMFWSFKNIFISVVTEPWLHIFKLSELCHTLSFPTLPVCR
jgi:hypothetical protein